jgi:hypothetical protein
LVGVGVIVGVEVAVRVEVTVAVFVGVLVTVGVDVSVDVAVGVNDGPPGVIVSVGVPVMVGVPRLGRRRSRRGSWLVTPNSSAPISGVVAERVSPSKSMVIPAIGVPRS